MDTWHQGHLEELQTPVIVIMSSYELTKRTALHFYNYRVKCQIAIDIYLFSKHLNICKRVNLSYICKKSEVYRSHKFPLSAQGPSNFVTLNSFQNTGRGGFEECDRKVVKFLNVISL